MPNNFKRHLVFTTLVFLLIIIFAFSITTPAYEGIETYYIRYDVKSSKNKIINDNLLMIPAKNDFRAENFSQILTKGVIPAASGESKAAINKRIRENSLKTILVNKGLKSVKAKDLDTVVSYEGVIVTPIDIIKNNYQEERNGYFYTAQIEFSPIAFPDKWEPLNTKSKIKKMFHNFFQLFK